MERPKITTKAYKFKNKNTINVFRNLFKKLLRTKINNSHTFKINCNLSNANIKNWYDKDKSLKEIFMIIIIVFMHQKGN